MHYLTIKTELSYADAECTMQDLLVQDSNLVVKDGNALDEEYNEALSKAMRIVLEYYGGEQALQRLATDSCPSHPLLEPQQQEMEL